MSATKSKLGLPALIVLVAVTAAACAHANPTKEGPPMKLELTSTSFKDGEPIPAKFTCDDADVSPSLKWSGVPASAKSLALICEDPDAPAGTWVHWVQYDLPVTVNELPEAVPSSESTPQGAKQGINDFGRVGYGGPCPPPGKAHRYFFKLYALDQPSNLKPRATKSQLETAMRSHILAEDHLMGTYQRK